MKFNCYRGNGKVTTLEIPDEEWNQMIEKRLKALSEMPWKEAILKYPDGLERRTEYKIHDCKVYLNRVDECTGSEYHDLCIQARAWDDRRLVEKNEKKELAKVMADEIAEILQNKTAILTDLECLKRLVDTGFIMQNERVKGSTKYIVKKGYAILDVFDELSKITGSEMRARAIMMQNMTKVESTLNKHRPKKSLKN